MGLRQRLRLASPKGWETPLILFGVVLLSYGVWIPWMGLFGDDLSYMYYYHLLGAWGPGYFASDRPISGLFYAASMALLGEHVFAYQVLLLVLRWLSAVLLWWLLGLVWPEHKTGAAVAALLFAVYPGFRQNAIALEFILHFFVLDLTLLSLGATLLSVRQPGRFWIFAALSMLGAAGAFMLEYFVGLEILRPIFLWVVTRRAGLNGKVQWRRIIMAWLPALVVMLAFLYWRVFVFAFPTYKPVLLQNLRAHPLSGLIALFSVMAHDLWTASGAAWLQTVYLPATTRSALVYLGLALACAVLVGWLFWRRGAVEGARPHRPAWGAELLAIGLLAMLAGGVIFWITGIPVTLDFPWDRSTLALMPGASLMLAGLLDLLFAPRYQVILVAALVILAVGLHFKNAQEYHAEWQKLQDFYWQLTWRAPQLAPGTLALFDVIPLNRYSDNDMTALLNWTYAPTSHDRQIAYKFFDLTIRLDSPNSGLPGLAKGLPVEHNQRGLLFTTTTSSTLAMTYQPPSCLRVLDPAQDVLLPVLPERIQRVLPMTNLAQVQVSGAARPPVPLGPEPTHGWCYFFQKADLARQQADWRKVAEFGDQASQAGLHPADVSELLPFIEGYARASRFDQAHVLSQAVSQQVNLKPALCGVWKRVASDAALQQAAMTEGGRLGCPF
ncbi:MAG TPA: hypothetical protein VF806_03625 [Anaerolineaceae bacterium]